MIEILNWVTFEGGNSFLRGLFILSIFGIVGEAISETAKAIFTKKRV